MSRSHRGLDQVIHRGLGHREVKTPTLTHTIPPSTRVNKAIGSLTFFPEIIMINLYDDCGKNKNSIPKDQVNKGV